VAVAKGEGESEERGEEADGNTENPKENEHQVKANASVE